MSKVIYADNSATTAPSKKVIDAMTNCYEQHFGNPSSMYSIGRDAKEVLDHARSVTAKCLGAAPDEIYFTSGGSESDNWAIKGVCREKVKIILSLQPLNITLYCILSNLL